MREGHGKRDGEIPHKKYRGWKNRVALAEKFSTKKISDMVKRLNCGQYFTVLRVVRSNGKRIFM